MKILKIDKSVKRELKKEDKEFFLQQITDKFLSFIKNDRGRKHGIIKEVNKDEEMVLVVLSTEEVNKIACALYNQDIWDGNLTIQSQLNCEFSQLLGELLGLY